MESQDYADIVAKAQQIINGQEEIYTDFVYEPRLLKLVLPTDPPMEMLRSMISRCIERSRLDSLEIIFGIVDPTEVVGPKHLYLRWISSIPAYLLARQQGWYDPEWGKRLVAIQRRWRARRTGQKYHPRPHRFEGPDLDQHERSNKYFGWRHSLYNVRWNPRYRYRFYKRLIHHGRIGDCAWESYCTYLNEHKKNMPR